jgi:hypothetical protein
LISPLVGLAGGLTLVAPRARIEVFAVPIGADRRIFVCTLTGKAHGKDGRAVQLRAVC